MRRLRVRLLASYVILLVVTLNAIVLTLFLSTSAQQAPSQPTFQRLTALVRGLDLRTMILEFSTIRDIVEDRRDADANIVPLRDRDGIITEIQVEYTELLAEFADTRDVRVIWFTSNAADQVVVRYDSEEIFTTNEPIDPRYIRIEQGSPDPQSYIQLPTNAEQVYGVFNHAGEWLFSGVATYSLRANNDPEAPPLRRGLSVVVLAAERPTQSLQDVLAQFSTDLALPMLQASIAGLLIAVVLATVISRTIARPLQAVSRAATAVAEGELEQRVPVSGPEEVRNVAEAFNHMSAEVLATQQSQQDFLANVSHDLKTPLTSIQGYSQAIVDGTAKQPEKAASIIYDEASRLTRMVIELTDLARMEAGQLSLNLTSLDVGQIVNAVAQKLKPLADRKSCELVVQVDSHPHVAADGDRLVQVFNNLIGNAIKYTPREGRVLVKSRIVHEGVEIVVSDNGIGIPKEDLPRIFERFYQVDKARGPRRGTGLGLAIVHEIVHLHGGRIRAQSVEGQGTQFTVWLPFDYKADTAIMRRR